MAGAVGQSINCHRSPSRLSCTTAIVSLQKRSLVSLIANVVHDISLTGITNIFDALIISIDSIFKLETISHGPGRLRLFGISILQKSDGTIVVSYDAKLGALESFPICRMSWQQIDDPFTAIEKAAFMSMKSSVGWIDSRASLICADFASIFQAYMQQATVIDLL